MLSIIYIGHVRRYPEARVKELLTSNIRMDVRLTVINDKDELEGYYGAIFILGYGWQNTLTRKELERIKPGNIIFHLEN